MRDLKALYDAGFLTRWELYQRVTERLPVAVEAVRTLVSEDPGLEAGLREWMRAIANGNGVIGGEWADSPSETTRKAAAALLEALQAPV